MKVNELPPNTNLRYVKVMIPEHIEIPAYGTAPTREVYLRGYMWGSMMVSLEPDAERVYPILSENVDFTEWEVIDEAFV